MGCGCEKDKPKHGGKSFTKAVVEIVNPEKITLLRKVVIPASLGDETTIPPAVGDYHNVILTYEASKRVYLYSSDGIPTFISTDLDAIEAELERLGVALEEEINDRETAINQINSTIDNHTTQISNLSTGLDGEITSRQEADTNLQNQIDAISASSDVKDIVGTHQELERYDTTTLGDNDIIKVLQDETQDGATTYYRWDTDTHTFSLIGEEGPYYTKAQADTLLSGKQDTLTAGENISIVNNVISSTAGTYSAGTGLELNGTEFSIDDTVALKTEIPTVNNGALTIQKNGTDVASFTANSGTNVTANITVPTDTAQLSNGAGFQTASDVSALVSGKQDALTAGSNIQINGTTISATDTTYSAGNGLNLTGTVFSADTDILQTKLTPGNNITIENGVISSSGGEYTAGNGLELTNNVFAIDDSVVALKSDIPIISSASLTIQRNGVDVATFTTDSATPVTANITVPTNNAQLANGAGYQTASDVQSLIIGKQDVLTPGNNIQITGNTISATDTKYSAGDGLNLTGTVFTADTDILATKSYVDSVVPEDMVVLSYGNSTWNDFITAYNDNRVVYCRASSNADPSTGSQTRLAFMAYVNNGTNPTNVEFQYYRSVSSHSNSQQGDQVYVYKLESNGTWTVTVRNAFSKVVAGNNMTSSYSNGAITLNATVPTDVSELNNDAGYLTNTDYATDTTGGVVKVGSGLQITNGVLSATGGGVADAVEWADVLNKPTDVSYWNNDAGYLTSVSWNDILSKPTFATVATSGSYNDLSDKPTIPTIPTNVSAFTNDANYQNSSQVQSAIATAVGDITSFDYQVVQTLPATGVKGTIYLVPNSGTSPNIYDEYIYVNNSFEKIGTTEIDLSDYVTNSELTTELSNYTPTASLATVATSGSYNDLTNKPSIPAAQVNSDWNATSGVAQILNKPTLATVATSGSYDDLSDKPTIPTVNNARLTIQKNGTTVKTFTANASSNVTANITVPTATSDLTNDSGFITGVAWGEVTGKPTFATVATTGSYDDLEDKPTIPAAQVNADWNAVSGVAQILNKPTIPTVPSAGTTASAVSTTASGGSATTWSKSDHVHSISSSTITSALGYTPYNSTNPNGYTSNTGTITGVSANGTSIATSGVANIPAATTSKYGVTQLSSATNSTSTSLAATPSAVKAAYDLANSKQNQLTAGTGIDITNNVISATAVANTFASYQNGTLYITNSARNADTENF